jgi:nitroreductase
MTVLEPIRTRRSVRRYSAAPVEDAKIEAMLESARLAPSGSNTQPWHFIVVRAKESRERVVEACHSQGWMLQAPLLIVCVADIASRLGDSSDLILQADSPQRALKSIIRDTAIAVEHMVLQAQSMGLSTCWVGYFDQHEIRPVLNIPTDKYVVAVLVVGYGAEEPPARPRKPLGDMVHFELWAGQGTLLSRMESG